MSVFIKFILIVVGIIYLVRWVFKLLFRAFIGKLAQQAQNGSFQSRAYTNSTHSNSRQQNQAQPKSSPLDADKLGGDYIDYEEVK